METYEKKETEKTVFEDIKAIIFDYGGTLDSAGRHWSYVLREGYIEAGVSLTDEQWKDAYVYGERALAKEYIVVPDDNFREVLSKKVDREFVCLEEVYDIKYERQERKARIEQIVAYCYDYALKHIEISREVLCKLSERYPMVLVSNFYGNIHSVLEDFRINCFKEVIESSVVGVRKPDPAIFRLGVESLGVSPDKVLVVGDSYGKDIVPASSLGCPTIWLRGEGWGKDPDDISIPRSIITDIRQLVPLLTHE